MLLPDDKLKPLESNEVFVHEIIGCRVEDQRGKILGEKTRFPGNRSKQCYEVSNGSSAFLIPDVPHVVLELNVETRE
ncbi:MAG: hypothetical protein Ct9H300mP28_33350 [Pseudomonadota bacterium]|nr:MAG: hypothetical protein Ct9H300mP28_33350 [Pseudomonadota bacterium]